MSWVKIFVYIRWAVDLLERWLAHKPSTITVSPPVVQEMVFKVQDRVLDVQDRATQVTRLDVDKATVKEAFRTVGVEPVDGLQLIVVMTDAELLVAVVTTQQSVMNKFLLHESRECGYYVYDDSFDPEVDPIAFWQVDLREHTDLHKLLVAEVGIAQARLIKTVWRFDLYSVGVDAVCTAYHTVDRPSVTNLANLLAASTMLPDVRDTVKRPIPLSDTPTQATPALSVATVPPNGIETDAPADCRHASDTDSRNQ